MPVTIERRTDRNMTGWAAWNGTSGVIIALMKGTLLNGKPFERYQIKRIFRDKTGKVREGHRRIGAKEGHGKTITESMGFGPALVPAIIQILNILYAEYTKGETPPMEVYPVIQTPQPAPARVEMDEVDALLTRLMPGGKI